MRLTLLALILIPVAVRAQTYDDYVNRAQLLVESDNPNPFILAALYDSAFAKSKGRDGDLYNAACANSLIGNTSKAIQFLRQAFEAGYDNFDWMYYDKDLNPLRNDPGYLSLEKKYRPDSVVYFFEILRRLNNERDVVVCAKRVSLHEDLLLKYSLKEIMGRVGVELKLTADSLLDFSSKNLRICKSNFETIDDSYSSLERLSLKYLNIDDCRGAIVLKHIKVNDFFIDRSDRRNSQLKRLAIDDVTVNGAARFEAKGEELVCSNSTFNIEVPADDDYRWGLAWILTYDAIQIMNTTFNSVQKRDTLYPFEFDLVDLKRLKIEDSKFNYPTRFGGNVADVLTVRRNSFPEYLDLIRLDLPEFDCYFPFAQISNSRLVRFQYVNNKYTLKGDSLNEYADNILYDDLTGLHKRLYDHYRDRADIASANSVYVKMKDLEILHLKSMEHRNSEETMRLRLNQLMGFYTDHATSPGKALVISFWIVLAFGVFYCFFPSEWDKTSKEQIIADFRLFIEKNEHGYVRPFFKMMRGLSISLLNAVALSMNAFITLGFGNIPTTGIARYMCIIQGMLGWFLLSLFTVALLNQVLL